jgi:YD repeat-containing protein
MNKNTFARFFIGVLFVSNVSFAQGIVNVSTLTGTANAAIPVYTVQSGGVSLPVSISYSGSGVKPKDVEGTAGMGWQLNAGGQVSRVVRGLPDDCTKDNSGATRLGWMSSSNYGAGYAGSYTIQNDKGITCSYETNDISNINGNIPYTYDTEPDMFYVSAPGLSCQLVYDRGSGSFKPVTSQDLVISYTVYGGTGYNASNIQSFTITNDKGITYVFGNAYVESVVKKTVNGSGMTYFGTQYAQYVNGITYDDQWNLYSITDASGNAISLSYTASPARAGTDPVILYLNGSTTQSKQYDVSTNVTAWVVSSIQTSGPGVSGFNTFLTFNWQTPTPGTGQSILYSIHGPTLDYLLSYSPVTYYNSTTGITSTRYFLRNFASTLPGNLVVACSSPTSYQFGYVGETRSGSSYSTTLPDSTSAYVDYWGYYSSGATGGTLIPSVYILNPTISYYPRYVIEASSSPGSVYSTYAITNNNRAITTSSVATGSLNKISYTQGGNTNIVYESNDYYDVPSGNVVQGGGIRVKQIIDSAWAVSANQTGSTNNMIRNYTYLNSSGVSSGKPVSLPQFAFTVPYSGSATGQALWTAATALSAYDLSTEDHTIMYTSVKVGQTGAGSTVYNYFVPATYWDTGATGEYIGRYSCTSTYGPIQYYTNTYPFIPNPNNDWERGLPSSIVTYNDAGTEVSETDYTYQSLNSPSVITAFKWDDGGPSGLIAKYYNQYSVLYNASQLAASVTKKVFDSPTLSQAVTSTVNYTYGSSYHHLLTQQSTTNSDNSTFTTNIKYTKDYPAASAGSNASVNALYYLQQKNINIPVETWQQVTPSGGSAVTTGASLNLFSAFTVGSYTDYLPSQQYKFVLPAGGSFTPMSISGQTLTKDANYTSTPAANMDEYDSAGGLQTADDGNKRIVTTFADHKFNHTIAVFNNAAYNEVAFNDFDSNFPTPNPNFTINGTGSTNTTGHTGTGYNLGTSQSLTAGITKNLQAQNYIFSVWLNSSATGTMTVTLSNGTSASNTISTNTGGVWKYVEIKIPVTSLPSTFTATVTTSAAVAIDDVLLYPDVAEVTTYAYDPTTHFPTAQTNTNGVSAYYSYDAWGRLLFQYDQDNNITLKKTYMTPADVTTFKNTTPVIGYSPNTGVTTATAVTFSTSSYNTDLCAAAGLFYHWDFGDGNSITTTATNPTHTYASAGTFSVNLTVTSPFFSGSAVASSASITVAAATASVTENNYTTGGGIASVAFSSTGYTHTYMGSDLPTTVPPGNYTITVTPSGQVYNSGTGRGLTNIVFTDGTNGNCFFYSTLHSSTFTWTVAAGDTLNFSVYNNNTCPFD